MSASVSTPTSPPWVMWWRPPPKTISPSSSSTDLTLTVTLSTVPSSTPRTIVLSLACTPCPSFTAWPSVSMPKWSMAKVGWTWTASILLARTRRMPARCRRSNNATSPLSPCRATSVTAWATSCLCRRRPTCAMPMPSPSTPHCASSRAPTAE